MPDKTRRKRGTYSLPSKKKKDRSRRPTILTRQLSVAQTNEPVSSPKVSLPLESVPTPMAKPKAVRYPYVATELRTIGILAGIMLMILIVLALVPLPW